MTEPRLETSDGRPALADATCQHLIKVRGKTKGHKGKLEERTKTLRVSGNQRPELLKFAAETGPDKDLVVGCAEGWEFVSAE